MSASTTDVLVVGGGLAGVAAATAIAEQGIKVTLLEQENHLGGRLAGWTEQLPDGTTLQMERGFHAFFRQYYNLRQLLRRIDPTLTKLKPLKDYPIVGPHGLSQSFAGLRTHAPMNVIDLVRQTDTLKLKHLLRINKRAALEMLAFDTEQSYAMFDQLSAKDYLDSLKFPQEARHMLFDVFSHSFFNPEDNMSAAEMLAMFHFYFMGNPEGLLFDVMREPFSTTIWHPFEQYLAKTGVILIKNCQALRVHPRPHGFTIQARQDTQYAEFQTKTLILALNVPGIQRVIRDSPELGDVLWRKSIESLRTTARFVVWRLWLDRPVWPDRAEFVGTTGVGLLDNISLYHRIEKESAQWATQTGGSVVELHAYAVAPEIEEAAIKENLLQGLNALYPETSQAGIVHHRFMIHQDCPAFAPGSYTLRPGVISSHPQLMIAGDFVRLPFPSALMERAVTSGFLAANHLLQQQGLPTVPIHRIPSKGLASWIHKKPDFKDAYRHVQNTVLEKTNFLRS